MITLICFTFGENRSMLVIAVAQLSRVHPRRKHRRYGRLAIRLLVERV